MLATPHSQEQHLWTHIKLVSQDKAILNQMDRAVQNGQYRMSRLVATRSNGTMVMEVMMHEA